MELNAVAVVVGATVWIGPPVSDASDGMRCRWDSNWSQPSPSSTSSTARLAERTGLGIHDGRPVAHGAGPSSAGMMPRTLGPA